MPSQVSHYVRKPQVSAWTFIRPPSVWTQWSADRTTNDLSWTQSFWLVCLRLLARQGLLHVTRSQVFRSQLSDSPSLLRMQFLHNRHKMPRTSNAMILLDHLIRLSMISSVWWLILSIATVTLFSKTYFIFLHFQWSGPVYKKSLFGIALRTSCLRVNIRKS